MRRTPLILGILLALSLAVNLLILGAFLGNRASRQPAEPGPTAMERAILGPDRDFRSLPESLRGELRRRLVGNRQEVRQQLRRVQEARQEVIRILRARPFDPEDARAALARYRGLVSEGQGLFHEAILDIMTRAQEQGRLPPAPVGRPDGRPNGPPGGAPDGPPNGSGDRPRPPSDR